MAQAFPFFKKEGHKKQVMEVESIGMNYKQVLETKAIEKNWSQAALQVYLTISERLQKDGPLTIHAGVGGISFYKKTGKDMTFLVRFVAVPKRLPSQMGYLEFRKDSLQRWIDIDDLVEKIKYQAGPDTLFREGKVWCGLFFPLSRTEEITDLIRRRIVSRVGNSIKGS